MAKALRDVLEEAGINWIEADRLINDLEVSVNNREACSLMSPVYETDTVKIGQICPRYIKCIDGKWQEK